MNKGFWEKLEKPIMVLAPMANVTDASFRSVIAKYGKPDVTWTEFVSVDGLVSEGREHLLVDFWYSEAERPIVAQIFGAKPENFFKVAKLIKDLKFDGIDINMGCPDRAVLKQGAGGGLIKTPKLAQEIIQATQEGGGGLPVSVKTRLGVSKVMIDEWLSVLAQANLAAITMHLRTVKELSLVPAHWELMPEVVKIIKNITPETLVLGNGDVLTLKDAEDKCAQYGIDGVMIGRGIFGNPWMFNKETPIETISIPKRLSAMVEHTKLFEEKFQNVRGKHFETMKKHYKAYVNNFDGAKELRMKLMDEAQTAADVERITSEFFSKNSI
ncbi:MAG TPA: tRNA-dihydrouridine synthase [Methylomirabilota bacterium]|nr:tRNA-dihydrouridine synthase [Methylomirabilota bacterium]